MRFDRVVITCEHGGNRVPKRYRALFGRASKTLASHRGWDPGALAVARLLARKLGAPLHQATITRLLVDLNRSSTHPRRFSEWTEGLSVDERERIDAEYYRPYHFGVREQVAASVRAGLSVLHISSHSFTPILRGERRSAEIGILYDPSRAAEKELAIRLQRAFSADEPTWRVRRNYPYAGAADGLTTILRRSFPAESYMGLEIEVNQSLVRSPRWARHSRRIANIVGREIEPMARP